MPSTEPNQWFFDSEAESSQDPTFEGGKTPESDPDSPASSSDAPTPSPCSEKNSADGIETDSECEIDPNQLAEAVHEAASMDAGGRSVKFSGTTYPLGPQGQGKNPLKRVFNGEMPKECEQLRELFHLPGGKRYLRAVIKGEKVEFDTVPIKDLRGIISAMLNEVGEEGLDFRVFCQQYTSESVFNHLMGKAEKKKEAPKPEAPEPEKKEEKKTEAPKPEAPKPEAPKQKEEKKNSGEGDEKKKRKREDKPAPKPKQKRPKTQTTLDKSVVRESTPTSAAAPVAAPVPAPVAAPARTQPSEATPSRIDIARLVQDKLEECTHLLKYLEQSERNRATERALGL